MISATRCAKIAGLTSREVIIGVEPATRHRRLLCGYVLNMHRGTRAVWNMIVADLRSCVDLGAKGRAADLFIVLRLFLSDYGYCEKKGVTTSRARGRKVALAHARRCRSEFA